MFGQYQAQLLKTPLWQCLCVVVVAVTMGCVCIFVLETLKQVLAEAISSGNQLATLINEKNTNCSLLIKYPFKSNSIPAVDLICRVCSPRPFEVMFFSAFS